MSTGIETVPLIGRGTRVRDRGSLRHVVGRRAFVPHQELAITWDVVHAVLTWEDPSNKYITQFFADPKNDFPRSLVELGAAVSSDVELGYHLCYGSQDHKHALEPRDLSACVTITNAVAAKLDRRIDYVHMPVPRERTDDDFFKPLGQLDCNRLGEVYLGLVHYTDGVEGARRRINAAERYLSEFGVATECGFGRRPSHQDVMRLIKLRFVYGVKRDCPGARCVRRVRACDDPRAMHADIIDDARKS
jgi:hypothetical protein